MRARVGGWFCHSVAMLLLCLTRAHAVVPAVVPAIGRRWHRFHRCFAKPPRPNAQWGLRHRGTHAPRWPGPTRTRVCANNTPQAHVRQANPCSAHGWYVFNALVPVTKPWRVPLMTALAGFVGPAPVPACKSVFWFDVATLLPRSPADAADTVGDGAGNQHHNSVACSIL